LKEDASASFFCFTRVSSTSGSYPPRRTLVLLDIRLGPVSATS
jgi:hypothetical protein